MGTAQQYEYIIYLNDKMSATMRKVASLSVSEYDRITRSQERLNKSTENYSRTLKNAFGGYLGAQGVKILAQWGSELKQTTVQFQTLASSTKAGDALYEQLKRYANITPYVNRDINRAAVTMMSFGVAEEKIMPGIKMIGDIAAGNAERFQNLSLAYAQSQAAGKLMGQDLLQMINAGFNPLQEISKKTGVSLSVLRKQMENGAISSKMVEDAFRSATSEGGRFDGMMNKMSKEAFAIWSNITGQAQQGMANLSAKMQDALTSNLASIEAITTRFLEWTDRVNINAERIGKWVQTLLQAGKALLLYKTATIGATLWMKYLVPAWKAGQYALFALRFQIKFATAETFAMTNIVRIAKTAWIGMSAAMKANAIGLAVTGLAMLVSWLGKASKAADDAEESQRAYNDQLSNTEEIARRKSIEDMLSKYDVISKNGVDFEVNLSGGAFEWMKRADKLIAESGIGALTSFQALLQDEIVSTQRKLDQLGDKEPNIKVGSLQMMLEKVNAELLKYDKSTGGTRGGVNFNTDTSTNITSGGSRPTNITINLGKLQDKIEIHAATVKESAAQMETIITETLLRVLNSSARIATQ